MIILTRTQRLMSLKSVVLFGERSMGLQTTLAVQATGISYTVKVIYTVIQLMITQTNDRYTLLIDTANFQFSETKFSNLLRATQSQKNQKIQSVQSYFFKMAPEINLQNPPPQLNYAHKHTPSALLHKDIQPPQEQASTFTHNQENYHIITSAGSKPTVCRYVRTMLGKLQCGGKCLQAETDRHGNFYKKYCKQINALLSIAMTLIIFYNYQSFKEHCPYNSQSECLQNFILPKVKVWLPQIIVDCVFCLLQIHLLLRGSTYRLVPLLGVLQIVLLYVLSDQTISPTYYIGAVNFVHISLLAIMILFYLLLGSMLFCAYKNKKLFYSFMLLLAVGGLFFYSLVMSSSCDHWQKGINGNTQQIEGVCNMKKPTYCWNKILDGYFRLDWAFNDCQMGPAARNHYNRYFEGARSTGPFISLSNPNTFTEIERTDSFMQNSTFKHAKGFQSLAEAMASLDRPDVIFDSQNQVYHIEVQMNETLIRERAELWQKAQESAPLAKNVLFFYVDAISRQSAHLILPKITKWFQKQASLKSYQRKEESRIQAAQQDQAYEFYRYASLRPWTLCNEYTMMYGVNIENSTDMEEQSQHIIPSLTKSYMERGYITGSANSLCQTMSANIEEADLDAFETTRYDHESQSFACDPNFQDPENIYSFVQGPYSSGKRCLYGKIIAEYVSDYAYSFFQTYKDQPKYSSMNFLQGHEGTGEGLKNIDQPLSDLLEKLQSSGLLQDTMVMLVSNHGLHMQGVMSAIGVESFLTEKNLPLLMVRLPEKMNKKYRDSIRMNQQYVVTSNNIHHFLKHIVEGEHYEGRALSLLGDLTGNDSCSKLEITDLNYCSCKW